MKPSPLFCGDPEEKELGRTTELLRQIDKAVAELYDYGYSIEGTYRAITIINDRHRMRKTNVSAETFDVDETLLGDR